MLRMNPKKRSQRSCPGILDAAQKKVMRAMEKLREILLRREATASSVSLAGILEVFECGPAPPALAASIGTISSASMPQLASLS